MRPHGGLGDQLQLVDIVPHRIEHGREIGLGVEHVDWLGLVVPVPARAGEPVATVVRTSFAGFFAKPMSV